MKYLNNVPVLRSEYNTNLMGWGAKQRISPACGGASSGVPSQAKGGCTRASTTSPYKAKLVRRQLNSQRLITGTGSILPFQLTGTDNHFITLAYGLCVPIIV